ADLVIAVQGDKLLFNQYGVILVNPAKHPHVKKELGQQFIDWLISDEGQKAIADYKIDGEQVFWPQRERSGRDDCRGSRARDLDFQPGRQPRSCSPRSRPLMPRR